MAKQLPGWAIALIVGLVGSAIVIGLTVGLAEGIKSNGNGGGGNLPLIKPPVQNATPPALKGNSSSGGTQSRGFAVLSTPTINPQDIVDRFFNPDGGPTDLFVILAAVDSRISGINDRIGQFPCIHTRTPVAYNLSTWGTNETFYAQCSEIWGGGQGYFDQFAVVHGTFYLFEYGGETSLAARVENYNVTGADIKVTVWFSVGQLNRNGSHAVVQILAKPKQQVFEMTVAGNGIGYCGAQLKSTATAMNVTGSTDQGATCLSVASTCVSSTSIFTSATCTSAEDAFTLDAIGRSSFNLTGNHYGASQYGRLVFIDPAAHKDDVDFGPRVPVV